MGAVYDADQLGANGFVKQVAIKIIRPSFCTQQQFIDNFIGEAKLVSDLIHTNIVQTYHLGESTRLIYAKMGVNPYGLRPGQKVYYIAMELIHGSNLQQFSAQLTAKGQPLSPELAVFIASRIARGLAYAHAKRGRDGKSLGIVHRDISPKNVMVSYQGDVKLIDFGVAKAAGYLADDQETIVTGRSEYMSPEQANFQDTDKRADIFSTAVVLSELLLGYNIFRCPSIEDSRERIKSMEIPDFRELSPNVDDNINNILQRALARDLDKRYPDAKTLLHDLEYNIYHKGYGPTNETLGKFVRELFDQPDPDQVPAEAETAPPAPA